MIFRKTLIGICTSLLLILAAFFLFRNTLLQWFFQRVQTYALQHYNVKINVGDIRFTGLEEVFINHLVVYPLEGDTLLKVNKLHCNVSLLSLFTASVNFDEIEASEGIVTIYNLPDRSNLKFLSSVGHNKQRSLLLASTTLQKATGYKELLLRALHTAFDLRQLNITYSDTAHTEELFIPFASYNLHELSAVIINQLSSDTIELTGEVLSRNKSYYLRLRQYGPSYSYLPFLDNKHSLQCKMREGTANVTIEDSGGELLLTTDCSASDFHLRHWRIAKDDILFSEPHLRGLWRIRSDAIELDSSTIFTHRSAPFHLFASYSTGIDTTYRLRVHMPETPADSFFAALPAGMFTTLQGISCTGTLAYDLDFFLNSAQPDSLIFESSLRNKNLRLRHYGAENYARVNSPFVYDAYDKDRFVRSIAMGPSNPRFTPLAQISTYLPMAVLQSEDPSFMNHRGFLAEAFRESIAKNYKERRFARGGSTISMQLVKNLYLSRSKTISRKLEEALIVYLIENLHLVPKERMLEIYLNIIEWGPNVYGIGEAAPFYFGKSPASLTLAESIFLAAIIPAPRHFRYQFDKQGHLRPHLDHYFRILTGRMTRKGWLSGADSATLPSQVILSGPALRLVLPPDSLPPSPLEEDIEN